MTPEKLEAIIKKAKRDGEVCDCEHCAGRRYRYAISDKVFSYSVYALITSVILVIVFLVFK